MKFDVAWADVASRNATLKVFAALVSILSVVLCVGLVRASTMPPVVIERGCETELAPIGSADHTQTEIEQFVRDAVLQRYDHRKEFTSSIFSQPLASAYLEEAEQMQRRGLKQSVIVNEIAVDGAEVTVDADRVITFGKVRVALRFRLILKLAKVERTPANPSGLVVDEIQVLEDIDAENDK